MRGGLVELAKRPVRRTARALGFEIRRHHPGGHADGYRQQARLLGGSRVRTIFDIGAYHGDSTASYRALFPEAHVHCLEPSVDSADIVRKRFHDDDLVTCHAIAAGEVAGVADLYRSSFGASNSLLAPASRAGDHVPAHLMATVGLDRVPCTTVDELRAAEGIERIGILKIDTQGADLAVLRGARAALAEQRIDAIYVELLFVALYAGQCDHHQVCALLDAHGYALYDLYEFNYTISGRLAWCDGLFLRRGILEDGGLS